MTEEKALVKAPINIDLTGGIVPKDYNEVLQMASLLHASGLAPASLDTTQKVAVAMFMCIELERPVITGCQDIAVINGKAGIFGDAALAIVRSSGLLEKFKEWEEGTPYTDDWTFYCEVKRKDMAETRKGAWSWVDAQRAGFDDPKKRNGEKDVYSPWRRFTRRMMQFKARNFPLRDEFGDVLKGMRLSEDNMDAIDMYPDAAGAYKEEAKTEKVKVEGIDEINADFRAFAKTLDVEDVLIEAFIKETSEANKMTVRAVKSEALKDYDSFKIALEKWVGEKEKAEEQDGPDLFDRLKAMRPGTSTQNKDLFKKQVLENLDEIRSWPKPRLHNLEAKWGQQFPDSSLTDILAETVAKEEEEKTQTQGYVDAIKTGASEDRDPNPPASMFEKGVEAGEEHIPPWKRRKHFLDAMKDAHDKNKTVYFNTLGANGYEKADDVPDEADKETEILAIMKSEIPG